MWGLDIKWNKMCINHSFALLHVPIKWRYWCLHYWWPQMNSCMLFQLFDEAVSSWDIIASMVDKWVWVCECWWNDTNGRTEVLWLLIHSFFSWDFHRSRILHKLKTNKYRTFLGLLGSEDEGIMTLCYTGSYSPSNSLLHHRRLESSTKINNCTKCSTWHHDDTVCMFCDTWDFLSHS
jgi:ribosomal protein L32